METVRRSGSPPLGLAVLVFTLGCNASEPGDEQAIAPSEAGAPVQGEPRGDAATPSGPAPAASDAGAPLAPGAREDAAPPASRADASAGPMPVPTPMDAGVDPSLEIYDPGAFPRFDLELPEASVAALALVKSAEDERQNTYVRATLRYGDEVVRDVGVRLKGEGSFQPLDRKPPLKLKFDEFVPDQMFHGLKRLTLNNAFEDPSFLAERLAYELFRAAELPAPRCNNATLYINGDFYGVYVNVEAEDKTFLRRWFTSDDGNLYEEGQKDFVPGAETAFNLETNETKNDRTHLRQLIATVQAASNGATLVDELSAHLDMKQFLRFTAAEASVNQWDMYAYTVFYVNNLRIYDDPTSMKFHFIPWGMDMSMKPFRDSGKPYISLFTLARQGDRAGTPISAGLVFRKCLESAPCKSAYASAVQEISEVYERLGLEAKAMSYYAQIRAEVQRDPRKNSCCQGGKLTNAQFEAGFQSVLTTIRGRVAALRADLNAR